MKNTETFVKMDNFLKETLSGFEYLTWIEQGDATRVLNNPKGYSLNHVSANIDAWTDNENIVIEFNNIGVHFCFTPIEKQVIGMLFRNGVWK